MAEITRRRTGEILHELFDILIKEGTGLKASEAIDRVANNIKLSDYEKGAYPSGGRRFDKILRFATVDCVKAGWLIKEKGIWSITDEGKKARNELLNPEDFYKQAVKLYREWKSSQPSAINKSEVDIDIADNEKSATITFEEAEEHAWEEIFGYFSSMNPYDFQHLVADLLVAMGYHISWVSPPGKDGGLDILALSDPLGTKSPKLKVQVKRQQSSVGVDGLRSFLALLNDDDVGVFVCTGGFTKDAEYEARNQTKRKITLIDAEKLFDLWVDNYKNLSDKAREPLHNSISSVIVLERV